MILPKNSFVINGLGFKMDDAKIKSDKRKFFIYHDEFFITFLLFYAITINKNQIKS